MIPEQLTFIYFNLETWHRNKLSEAEANAYHERLLVQGNILTYVREGVLIGYLEFYRINFEQFGRALCGISIPVFEENITDGEIAMITHMWIDKDYRNGQAWDMLSTMFLVKNKDAKYFATVRANKHNQPLQVYSREELIRLYTKGT